MSSDRPWQGANPFRAGVSRRRGDELDVADEAVGGVEVVSADHHQEGRGVRDPLDPGEDLPVGDAGVERGLQVAVDAGAHLERGGDQVSTFFAIKTESNDPACSVVKCRDKTGFRPSQELLLVVRLPPGRVGDAADERPAAVAVARAHREDLRAGAGDGGLEAVG